MSYRAAKISFDGSHYIATPKENFPQGHKRRRAARPLSVDEVEKKEQFEAAYKESQKLPRKERKAYMRKAMEETIPDKEQRKEYVERNNERKTTNAIRRKVRLSKKVNLQRDRCITINARILSTAEIICVSVRRCASLIILWRKT